MLFSLYKRVNYNGMHDSYCLYSLSQSAMVEISVMLISTILGNTCLFKKGKEKNKDNSTHIKSNSITYIIRRTSITDKHTN